MVGLFIFLYLFCGLITFITFAMFTDIFETVEIYNIKRYKRILTRLSYLFLWPIYFIGMLIMTIYCGMKQLISKIIE